VGYASSGLHTNGYTLARRVVFERMGHRVESYVPELGSTLGDALLAVHRSYATAVRPVLSRMHGLAHITGGGIAGNLVRILPPDARAEVDPAAWPLPPLFKLIQRGGRVSDDEMRDVFNLGIGLVAVMPSDLVDEARAAAKAASVDTWVIGSITAGTPEVRFT
jgi:phosphoribosylformylglycinamidine cyclo-ligase